MTEQELEELANELPENPNKKQPAAEPDGYVDDFGRTSDLPMEGFAYNAVKDAGTKLGQWWEGGKAGYAEWQRAGESTNQVLTDPNATDEQKEQAVDYNKKAAAGFTYETMRPASYAAGVFKASLSLPALINDAGDIVKEEVSKGGANAYAPNVMGAVAAKFSGVETVKEAVQDPAAFGDKLYKQPITTTMEVLPAALTGMIAYKGARGLARGEKPTGKLKPEELELLANELPDMPETRQTPDGDMANRVREAIFGQESGGDPTAYNADGEAFGKYQFQQGTWDGAAKLAGREDLVGEKPNTVSERDQDAVATAYIQKLLDNGDGDPKYVAAAWYAGEGAAAKYKETGRLSTASEGDYPSVAEYVDQVTSKLGEIPEGKTYERYTAKEEEPSVVRDVDRGIDDAEVSDMQKQLKNDWESSIYEDIDNIERDKTARTLADEIGVNENKYYSDAVAETKNKIEEAVQGRVKAEESPFFQSKLNKRMEEVRQEVEAELSSDPVYKASDSLTFDLQMFAGKVKNAKEVAEEYLSDKLTDAERYFVDTVAEQHGFSSGHELAKKIKSNKLKDEEIQTRLEYANEQFKKESLGDKSSIETDAEVSESKIKSTAAEASALREIANGSHRENARDKKVAAYVARFKDAEANLLADIQRAKDKAKYDARYANKIQDLQGKLSELKKQHSEEIKQIKNDAKYSARWYETEASTKNANLKEQLKHDTAMAKEFLRSETASQKIARQSEIGVKAAIEHAKTTLADKAINDAIAYSKYMKQARYAARQSEKAYRAGKYEEAAKWKNSEMLNHAMALEAMNNSKAVAKQETYIKKVVSKKKLLFKTDENFNQAGALLDRFELGRKDYSPENKTETLSKWADRMDEMLGTVNIPDWIFDESIRKNYKDLTMSELKDLTDALKNIQKVANQEKTSIAVKKGASLDEMKLEQLKEMENLKTVYNPKVHPKILDRLKDSTTNYLHQLQTMSTIIGRLQGWKTFGPLEEFWIKPVHERANLESKRIEVFKKEIENIWSPYSSKERKAMANNEIYYDEIDTSITKMDLLGLAFNIGNDGNRTKLMSTRPVGFSAKVPWNEKTAMDLLSNNLTEKDWTLVQKTWDMVNSIWPDLSKFHAEMTGFEPGKVEATPFDIKLPNGKIVHMEGGYYPLKQDARASLLAAERAAADSELYKEQMPTWKATTNQGATKQRTQAEYAIDLNPSVMTKHIIDVVHDLHFRDLVADYRRMLNNKDFQEAIRNKLGADGPKIFKDYIANIANGEAYRDVGMMGTEKLVNYFRKSATKAAIAYRVGVITQNAANIVLYPKAIEGFGVTDAAIGLINHGLMNYIPKAAFNWKAAQAVRDEVHGLSAFMRDRRLSPDFSLKDVQSNMFGDNNPLTDFGLSLLSASDDLFAVPMWKQAYEKQLAKTGDSKQSAYYADSLIKAVNGSGRKYDVSPIIRSSNVANKVFTSFYGFMNVEFNRWVRESGIAAQDIKNVPRFIGFAASRMVAFTVLSELLAGKGPEDKDNPVSYWAGKVAAYPLQLVPMVRDIAPLVINSVLGVQTYGYNPPIAFTVYDNIDKATTKTMSYINDTGKTTGQDVAESYAKVAAYSTGYPDQFNAWFFNLYDYFNNRMEPEVKDLMKRRPSKERGHEGLINELKKGDAVGVKEAKTNGEISQSEYDRLIKYQKLSPIEKKLDGANAEKSLKIYKDATDEEKQQIKAKVSQKVKGAMNGLTPKEQEELKNKAAILK
ncbi:hypothetical protein SPSIL_017140 [Sporomusa silvacetica DSM 10669]|uniref:Transglycosylase SLT domain protein n=1 Tax=Sporomusa silvacetica DSM 10669 TaxID=1123289 RepID=A0ABZ3IIS2_9FIRM|nr:hypothetical protein [Sporomusa silvacetica]OZC18367.1 hypothetical protein SPSIL_25670 [Sporomusa silvacetica DSM 10669]